MAGTALAAILLILPLQAAPPVTRQASVQARLRVLEARSGGRLGVAVLDTGSGRRIDYRSGERFPLCSTFKVLLAGAVLARVDAGQEALDRPIEYRRTDLLEHAPVTAARVAEGHLTVTELCGAAVSESDNTAANLLLGTLGGPTALTAFVRRLGDARTRLDRWEPDLNEARPGDPRDTTTPRAMVEDLRTLLLGTVLTADSRQRLESWMAACSTGRNKLRAGLPAGWTAGDKTGAGRRGTMNDVALLRPPGQAPILVAAYLTGSGASWDHREALFAELGRLVAAECSPAAP
ncbi:MAG TPA: class A beta-lactamase [Geothrix sp.]|nr:class A beta-lactamase [Geothrix sp.]